MTFAPQVTDEVAAALSDGRAVVALETTLVSHGFSAGRGLAAALDSEERVRAAGATPATVGVLDGAVRVGLTAAELTRFADAGTAARKVGARDLAACVVQGALGSTTVGGTLAVCRAVGIRFVGTGGIGGVHRGFAETLDISADLPQLARTAAVVVCSGAKSILDVAATAELLETLAVPVLGWQTQTLPMFYTADGRPAGIGDGRAGGRGRRDRGDALAADAVRRPHPRPAAGGRPGPRSAHHRGRGPGAPGRHHRPGGHAGRARGGRGAERRPQRRGQPPPDRRQRRAGRAGRGRLRRPAAEVDDGGDRAAAIGTLMGG